MVDCGTIDEKPSRTTVTVFAIMEWICLLIIFLCSAGSLIVHIDHWGFFHGGFPSIGSFITAIVIVCGVVLCVIGYLNGNDKFLKIAFYIFLVVAILDICIIAVGFAKHFHGVFFSNVVRICADFYVLVCLYFQEMRGSFC